MVDRYHLCVAFICRSSWKKITSLRKPQPVLLHWTFCIDAQGVFPKVSCSRTGKAQQTSAPPRLRLLLPPSPKSSKCKSMTCGTKSFYLFRRRSFKPNRRANSLTTLPKQSPQFPHARYCVRLEPEIRGHEKCWDSTDQAWIKKANPPPKV